ncbi:hypothetical protein SS50377_24927 [Spironucleus salmonicida]|uniref:Uncharacterized protein n=1 Tax=Spironucleus salmonicida TaxID=348837 RepID=V6LGL9_9EUKA|nr:hypothetical protein SS50377_24927 [Spironucleus salmonicida]|eukprot:EST43458.1 Hypothetical protein SS50377_16822 [Spironucleus salmonicida]
MSEYDELSFCDLAGIDIASCDTLHEDEESLIPFHPNFSIIDNKLYVTVDDLLHHSEETVLFAKVELDHFYQLADLQPVIPLRDHKNHITWDSHSEFIFKVIVHSLGISQVKPLQIQKFIPEMPIASISSHLQKYRNKLKKCFGQVENWTLFDGESDVLISICEDWRKTGRGVSEIDVLEMVKIM